MWEPDQHESDTEPDFNDIQAVIDSTEDELYGRKLTLVDTSVHSVQEFGLNLGDREEFILKAPASNPGDVLIGGAGRAEFPLSPGEGIEAKKRKPRGLYLQATVAPAVVYIFS